MRPHPDTELTELGVDFLFTSVPRSNYRDFNYQCKEPKTRNQDVKPECTNNGDLTGNDTRQTVNVCANVNSLLQLNMQPFVRANPKISVSYVTLVAILKLQCKTFFCIK